MYKNTSHAIFIFFAQKGAFAERVKELDGGAYSHVGLLLGGYHLLESVPGAGVSVHSLLSRCNESSAIHFVPTRLTVPDITPYLRRPYDWEWLSGHPAKRPQALHCATLIGEMFGLEGPRHPDLSLSELFRLLEARV